MDVVKRDVEQISDRFAVYGCCHLEEPYTSHSLTYSIATCRHRSPTASGQGDVERISGDGGERLECSPADVGSNERRPNLLTCQIYGYVFVDMHVKLLSSEAFLSCSKCSKYRSAAGLRPDPLGELIALP